jgi:hypothetical protein
MTRLPQMSSIRNRGTANGDLGRSKLKNDVRETFDPSTINGRSVPEKARPNLPGTSSIGCYRSPSISFEVQEEEPKHNSCESARQSTRGDDYRMGFRRAIPPALPTESQPCTRSCIKEQGRHKERGSTAR